MRYAVLSQSGDFLIGYFYCNGTLLTRIYIIRKQLCDTACVMTNAYHLLRIHNIFHTLSPHFS